MMDLYGISRAHPLFSFLTEQASGWFGGGIKWNFTKFLIDSRGQVRERFAPTTSPKRIAPQIEALLQEMQCRAVRGPGEQEWYNE